MVIVEENVEYGGIIGSSNAPYINSLANSYASATSWYAVQHNSPHDYLDLLSGSDQGLPNGVPFSATTLVDELHTKGIPWRAYMESMPSQNCFTGGMTVDGLYDPIHNPFHYFTNSNSNQAAGWCSSANQSTEGVLPYPGSSTLLSTLNGANAPDFVWITPNDCHDMHGDTNAGSTCASSTTSQLTQAGDTWLSSNIGPVISSPWFSQNGIIIITWDEGASMQGCCGLTAPGGHIATIVVTTNNKGLGKFTSSGDHYGTLAAIENAYGVPLLPNSGNSVNGDLSGAFGQPIGGSISGTVTDSATAAAISGATVSDGAGGSITSNGSGYTLNNVASGTYTVTASATGYATQSAPTVTVTAGATTIQNFALVPQLGTISGKVTDFVTRVGISGATVSYTGPGGSSGNTTSAGDGTYTLSTLPEGSYTVIAAATGYNSQTDAISLAPGATTTQNFTLPQSGSTIPCTGVGTTVSPPSAIAGTPVTVMANASGCPSPLYEFWVRTPDLVWHLTQSYGTASTYIWNTLDTQIGNYILEVLVKNTGSLGAYDAFASIPYSMPLCDTPTLSTGAATSPYASGSGPITLTASANCAGGAQYEFWYQDPAAAFHLIGSGYGAGNTAQWSADFKAGSYNLLVEVRPVGSSAAYVTYKFLAFTLTGCGAPTLAPDKTSPQPHGTLVTWTATVTCSGTPNYKFYVQSPAGVWTLARDWSATATFPWTSPAIAGTYHVQLWVRDAGALNDLYDNFTTMTFTIT
jgi:phosphatidylinositol-3-phosphatase